MWGISFQLFDFIKKPHLKSGAKTRVEKNLLLVGKLEGILKYDFKRVLHRTIHPNRDCCKKSEEKSHFFHSYPPNLSTSVFYLG